MAGRLSRCVAALAAVAVLLCIAPVVFSSTDYTLCEKDGEAFPQRVEIHSVEVEGCPPGTACKLRRSKDATLHLNFTASEELQELPLVVTGIMHGIAFPYPGHYQKDGCVDCGLTCPVPAGVPQLYTLSLPVNRNYPMVPNVKIHFEFLGTMCIEIPAKVV